MTRTTTKTAKSRSTNPKPGQIMELIPSNLENKQIAAPTPNPAQLLEMAVQQNFDIDKLEKLMELQERWEAKEAKKQYLEAFTRFQQIVPVISKNKTATIDSQTGRSYSYKYADLAHIGETIQSALKDTGLSYRFKFAQKEDGKSVVTCLVSHVGGHTEETVMESEKDTSGSKNKIQQSGSTNTFLQRYALIGALGLTTAEEDVDGITGKGGKKKTAPPKSSEGIDDEDFLDQWKQAINNVSTKIELNKLYAQNQSAVNADDRIKKMFKEKEETFKTQSSNPTTNMR